MSNLMCRFCHFALDPNSTKIKCLRCGSTYEPGAVFNRDLRFIGEKETTNFYDEIKAEDLAYTHGVSQRYLIQRTVKFVMDEYGLTEDEANLIIKEKVLGYK